ncbi:G-type lectin S-receptor-like serine/threonine-protein kinase At1g11330 isoform X2 [Benincasa hispida]|uniref:G-type lectin S-receptor-like serine/threonine-protein kinase At1g11330 isoform X2 n=1 Tax=Benincasa hispida TaxID=102211 RepID=UPI001901EFAE|nr:G-type lectin S-receptor-like serine/threonine-protein kinase At1g11330 isoform X2 [Benincasa hispida]
MKPISNAIPLILLLCFMLNFSSGIDTITSTQFLKDPETMLSTRGFFELGFFSPPNSTNRFVGIWDKRFPVRTVFWVANKDKPLNKKSGVFGISKDGNLVVIDEYNKILWNSKVSNAGVNSTARLLDSGNLVLLDSASETVIWESFKDPSDKFLPMMKFISNSITNEKVELVSWKTPSDPSSGNFSFGINPLPIPEVIIWKNSRPYWRSGPWDGQVFIGIAGLNTDYHYAVNLFNEKGIYSLSAANANEAQSYFYYLNPNGTLERNQWNFENRKWEVNWSALVTECDVYGACGAFGVCDSQRTPICSCLKGFRPEKEEEWNRGNWRSGCVRNSPLECHKKNISVEMGKDQDGFLKMEMVKVPDSAAWIVTSENDCRVQCLSNCSCSAYAYRTGIGCMIWRGGLIDIQQFKKDGADINVRVAYSEIADESGITKDLKVSIIASVVTGTLILISCIYCLWKRKRQNKFLMNTDVDMKHDKVNEVKLQQLPVFDFDKLAIATNHFHSNNKLGQGGFGPVYKGKLVDGQEIAVKRLSKTSGQGIEEFTNEVMVISKLQHRNLVQLFGCCVEGEERMLVYEYMPNGSLDSIIFDSTKAKVLDWRKRFNIIEGIARGVLYLHRDSRLKIIHRDLKASNILLDRDLNPKISDFGTARIVYGNEAQAKTTRVVGTYGYMSPEYVLNGQFSEKSDMFSFGVLLLEIISGRKNTSFYENEHASSLLGFAWKLWMEDNVVALIDQTMFELHFQAEILRCIHVGLLCVQELAKERPNITTILSMLHNEITDLPMPKQPGFSSSKIEIHTRAFKQSHVGTCTPNMITATSFDGR